MSREGRDGDGEWTHLDDLRELLATRRAVGRAVAGELVREHEACRRERRIEVRSEVRIGGLCGDDETRVTHRRAGCRAGRHRAGPVEEEGGESQDESGGQGSSRSRTRPTHHLSAVVLREHVDLGLVDEADDLDVVGRLRERGRRQEGVTTRSEREGGGPE